MARPRNAPAPQRMRATFPEGSLTASAERTNASDSSKYRRLNQGWQAEAFAYYHTLGECWYPAQFYAHALPNVRFYAGIRDPQGNVEELGPDDWASQQLDRIQDPGGGRSQLMEAFGRLNFLIGDGYLVGTLEDDDEGWEFLSPSELRAIPGTDQYARVSFPGATPEELTNLPDDEYEPLASGVVVYRVWNRDPEYSMLADSPVRAVLPLYKQLALLELAVTARAQSRVANAQILQLNANLSVGPADGQNDDDMNVDPFAQQLTQAFVRPIRTPGAASAVAPIIVRVPDDMMEKDSAMRMLKVSDPTETYPEREIRDEIRNRIALGLDMPAEIMLGLADSNNWNAFQINEDSWNAHLKPVVIRFCDDLGRAFLRPLAKQEGQEYTGGQLVVWFDESAVVNHPNRTEDVREGYRDGVVSSEKYREVIGLTEDDKPSDEEHEEFLLLHLRNTAQADEVTGEDEEEGSTSQKGKQKPRTPGPPPGAPSESKAQQAQLQDEDSSVTASGFAERAVGAAEMAVIRCYTLAGSRLRSKLLKDDAALAAPNVTLCASAGMEPCLEITGKNAEALVASGSEEFQAWMTAAGVQSTVVQRIGQLVEKHAAATLFEPAPLGDTAVAFVRKSLGGLAAAA